MSSRGKAATLIILGIGLIGALVVLIKKLTGNSNDDAE